VSNRLSNINVAAVPPDGTYDGLISGCFVRWTVDGVTYRADSTIGVRGMNCPVKIVVKDGKATWSSDK
jgi:hypothetical protein